MSRRIGLLMLLAAAGAAAQDTSFFSGEELAARLRQNLVRVAAPDIAEHGFGLVIGGDAQRLWVATARHVVVKVAMLGSGVDDRPSSEIRVRLCADAQGSELPAQPWPGWDAGGADLMLLSVARPKDYEPQSRALATKLEPGEPAWLLGDNDSCNPVPGQGTLRSLADARHNLRIDWQDVKGGSSGAPVLNGRGIVGLMKSADDVTTSVHAIADLQRRVQALAGVRWELVDARNIPPGDPLAAGVDLAELLNEYQLAVRNVHMLLQQAQIARPTLDSYMARYNAALQRYLLRRDVHDASLQKHWPPPVLPAWDALRAQLMDVHRRFWPVNELMPEIYRRQRGNAEVQQMMQALEPELLRLEGDIRRFLRQLAKEP